jgi:PTH1 family peptidyl-tRNA hydrolase
MSDAGETASPVRLIVGLGNPGSRYDGTRHNIGFALVDRLASGAWREKGKALLAEGTVAGKAVILMKPLTYMNLSGEAVTPVAQFHKIASGEVVVAHDDIDLPLGTVRLKHGGGDGGHSMCGSVSGSGGRWRRASAHRGTSLIGCSLGLTAPRSRSSVKS